MYAERLSIGSALGGERSRDFATGAAERLNGAGDHAVSFRVEGRTTRDILRRIRTEWGNSSWRLPGADVWLTSSVADPQSEAAAVRRGMERDLGLADPSRCRIVLIAYAAPIVDIVISADRRWIGRPLLLLLAEAIKRDSSVGVLPPAGRPSAQVDARGNGRPATGLDSVVPASDDWGLGGLPPCEGRGGLIGSPFARTDAEKYLVPAIALTLSRFRGGSGATVASLVGLATDVVNGPADALGLFILPDGHNETVAEFEQACVDGYRFAGWHSVAADCELRAAGAAVDACLWFDLAGPTSALVDDMDYRHCGDLAYPLNLALEPASEDALRLSYKFDRSLYNEAMVDSFDRCVSNVLRQLAATTTQGESAADDIQLLRHDNDHSQPGGRTPETSASVSLISALQHFVNTQPDAPAITFQDHMLTYAEFDRLSSSFAASIRALGVRKNDRVGVCLDRSLELVPVLAGILKCGATYVPIDPTTPAARKDFIIGDSDISLLIASQQDPDLQSKVKVVLASALAQAGEGSEAGCDCLDDESPAYIIYTSGSTGRPKGVLIAQQSVLALIDALRVDLALSPADRWTLFHSTAFDFATWEIWGSLLTGGHLFVVPFFVSRSPDEFVQLLADQGITVLNQTPTAFGQLQAASRTRGASLCLRLIIFGGETLDASLLLPWLDRYPGSACRIVNMYGITETTVHVTSEVITRRHALARSRTVGPPIAGWSVHIKDALGRHLPRGLTGEIYVGGSGLALGYWNNPEENAARFAFDAASGQRLYRSGDRGRLRPDGRLDHLGRMDNQVKLRGFRIELDEIRSVILNVAGVTNAMVALREEGQEPCLEAFVVASGRSSEIRAELFQTLPDYMVPKRVSVLEHFPLTVNGKFDAAAAFALADRQAAEQAPQPADQEQAPAGDADELASTLAAHWSGVFGQSVSPADNFFDLGGNSLIAVKLAALMRRLNCPVGSVRDIYVHQTPEELAKAWRDQLSTQND